MFQVFQVFHLSTNETPETFKEVIKCINLVWRNTEARRRGTLAPIAISRRSLSDMLTTTANTFQMMSADVTARANAATITNREIISPSIQVKEARKRRSLKGSRLRSRLRQISLKERFWESGFQIMSETVW
jgi:hypothetical protein